MGWTFCLMSNCSRGLIAAYSTDRALGACCCRAGRSIRNPVVGECFQAFVNVFDEVELRTPTWDTDHTKDHMAGACCFGLQFNTGCWNQSPENSSMVGGTHGESAGLADCNCAQVDGIAGRRAWQEERSSK